MQGAMFFFYCNVTQALQDDYVTQENALHKLIVEELW